jgi:tRNA pseudouridine38-40 synthase
VTRLRLDIAYDGTDFHGWAAQTGLRTVQGELELWIARVLRLAEPPTLTVAGRTDAGVHARGQVAHLDLETDDGAGLAAHLAYRLRAALPEDVVVKAVRVAPEGFDARFSAIWRRYVYRLCWDVPDPTRRRHVVAVPGPLDVPAMNAAAARLLGLRDFTAFCKAREGATAIRTLLEFAVADTGEITVKADAFCHSMVRSLVGALLRVGTAERDADWLVSLLSATERCGEIHVMPPHGLTLEEVAYPPDPELASRAQTARQTRCCGGEA